MTRFEGTIAAALLAALTGSLAAEDVVHLRNGNQIVGTVIEGSVQADEAVVVRIDPYGTITLRGQDVVAIESASTDSSLGRDYLAVTLKTGNSFYGNGTYFGRESSASDDTTLVLALENGVVRIPRDAIRIIETIPTPDKPAEPAAAGADGEDAETIATEHKLHLTNGRVLQGTLLGNADDDPLQLRLGQLGVVTVARKDVKRIENAPDTYKLPAPVEPPAMDELPADEGAPIESLDDLKEQLRAELLQELLGAVLQGRNAGDTAALESAIDRQLAAQLSNDDILHVEELLRDLSRQRNMFRTRAERKLIALGAPVLPFLRGVANHPFELTRRAVQRIVGTIGDLRGTPLAVAALDDSDDFVRQIAGETLRSFFPNSGIRYHENASVQKRVEAQGAYREAWAEYLIETTRLASEQP